LVSHLLKQFTINKLVKKEKKIKATVHNKQVQVAAAASKT
jgi:hypothetical protein